MSRSPALQIATQSEEPPPPAAGDPQSPDVPPVEEATSQRKNELDGMLSGMVGFTLRRLLGPRLQFLARRVQRKRFFQLRANAVPKPDSAQVVQLCMQSPTLSKLGEETLRTLLKDYSRYRSYDLFETMVFQDEPASATGVQIILNGSIAVADPSGNNTQKRCFTKTAIDSTGVGKARFVQSDPAVGDVYTGPVVLMSEGVFTEESSPLLVSAHSNVDCYILPFEQVRRAFRSLSAQALQSIAAITLPARKRVFASQYEQSKLLAEQSWIVRGLDEFGIQGFLSKLHPMCFYPQQAICKKGLPAEYIFFLRRGTVLVVGAKEGTSPDRYGSPNPKTQPTNIGGLAQHSSGAAHLPLEGASSVTTLLSKTEHDGRLETPLVAFGEMSMVFGEKVASQVNAVTICDGWALHKNDYDAFLSSVSDASAIVQETAIELRSRWLFEQKASTTNNTIQECLGSIPYLQGAPQECLDAIIEAASPQVYTMYSPIVSSSEWCHSLVLILRGTATSQQGGVSDNRRKFTVGSVLGSTCVVEHRSLAAICALTMVDAWHLSRTKLLEILTKFGLRSKAMHMCTKAILEEYKAFGVVVPKQLGRPVDIPNDRKIIPIRDIFTPRVVHYTDSTLAPGSRKDRSRRKKAPVTYAKVMEDGKTSGRRQKKYHEARMFPTESYAIDEQDPDINRGLVERRVLCSTVSLVPSRRHHHFKAVREYLAEKGEADWSNLQNNAPQPHQGSRATPPEEAYNGTLSQLALEDLSDTSPRPQASSKAAPTQVHKLPYTFMVVQSAERLGLNSPWMLELLGRNPLVPGYLEGSTPQEGTMEDTKAHWNRIWQMQSMTSISSDGINPSLVVSPQGRSINPGQRPETPPPANPYKPVRPHGYAAALPQIAREKGEEAFAMEKQRQEKKEAREKAARTPEGRAAQTAILASSPTEVPRRPKWNRKSAFEKKGEQSLIEQILTKNIVSGDMNAGNMNEAETDEPPNFFEEEWERMLKIKVWPKASIRSGGGGGNDTTGSLRNIPTPPSLHPKDENEGNHRSTITYAVGGGADGGPGRAERRGSCRFGGGSFRRRGSMASFAGKSTRSNAACGEGELATIGEPANSDGEDNSDDGIATPNTSSRPASSVGSKSSRTSHRNGKGRDTLAASTGHNSMERSRRRGSQHKEPPKPVHCRLIFSAPGSDEEEAGTKEPKQPGRPSTTGRTGRPPKGRLPGISPARSWKGMSVVSR